MRTLVITVLLALAPFVSSAKFGWRISNFSWLYGFTYFHDRGFAHSFELLYDYAAKNCRSRKSYIGFAFVGNFDDEFQEAGIKMLATPSKRSFLITRRLAAHPFIFVQGNWKNKRRTEGLSRGMNFRPGIGVNTNLILNIPLVIKTGFQIGYTLWDKFSTIDKGLTIEFRVGIGLNTFRLKPRKSSS